MNHNENDTDRKMVRAAGYQTNEQFVNELYPPKVGKLIA
jgi:hypothetical protein